MSQPEPLYTSLIGSPFTVRVARAAAMLTGALADFAMKDSQVWVLCRVLTATDKRRIATAQLVARPIVRLMPATNSARPLESISWQPREFPSNSSRRKFPTVRRTAARLCEGAPVAETAAMPNVRAATRESRRKARIRRCYVPDRFADRSPGPRQPEHPAGRARGQGSTRQVAGAERAGVQRRQAHGRVAQRGL